MSDSLTEWEEGKLKKKRLEFFVNTALFSFFSLRVSLFSLSARANFADSWFVHTR